MIASFIDLAPGHKIGLAVANPILLSPIAAGFGDRLPRGDTGSPGAMVVGPVSAAGHGYGRAGVVEVAGGVIVLSAGFSRGARRAVECYAGAWQRAGCPVVVQLVDDAPADFARAAARLADAQAVAGIERIWLIIRWLPICRCVSDWRRIVKTQRARSAMTGLIRWAWLWRILTRWAAGERRSRSNRWWLMVVCQVLVGLRGWTVLSRHYCSVPTCLCGR